MAKLFSRRTAAIVAVAAASMLVLSACSKSDSGSDKVADVQRAIAAATKLLFHLLQKISQTHSSLQ
ncbi:MAG: hypothetical protein RL201_511 [Actinomycetota bacterium]